MATTARSVLRADAARLLTALLWSGTASGGSTTSLTDTGDGGLRDTGYAVSLFGGSYLLLTSGADAGAWRQITPTGYVPSTGVVTIGEAFTTGPVSGTTYEIYLLLDPGQWNTIIDDALRRLRYEYRGPITLVTDGDMEASGTTDWTASSATLSKQTSGAFISGIRALRVLNSAANGYAQSATIDCNPGDGFRAWADYQAVSGTARLRAWDVTNGASIAVSTGRDDGDNREGGQIYLTFTVPSTARQIALRLIGDEATADIWWENIILQRNGRKRYALPSWIVDRDQLIRLEERYGQRPFEYDYAAVQAPINIHEDQTAANIFHVILPDGVVGPVYCFGSRAYGTLASDSATTTAPLEWAKYAVAVEALERYSPFIENSSLGRLNFDKQRINNRYEELSRRFMPRPEWPMGTRTQWVASGPTRSLARARGIY